MRVIFYYADKSSRTRASGHERKIAKAFGQGVRNVGDEFYAIPTHQYAEPALDGDVAVMFGVKSVRMYRDHKAYGYRVVMLDKGYVGVPTKGSFVGGRRDYYRVAANGLQPKLPHGLPDDRWRRLGVDMLPMREPSNDGNVILALSSQKYCDWYGHGDANHYAARWVKRLRKVTKRRIIYRPKPSFKDAHEIRGAAFSRPPETLREILTGAHVLCTHGSGAAVDAVIAGVPVLAWGDSITKRIATFSHEAIERLYIPSDQDRYQFLSDLAYCQWSIDEMVSGEAWAHIRPELLL